MLLEPSRNSASGPRDCATADANPVARFPSKVERRPSPSCSESDVVARTREQLDRRLEPLDRLASRLWLQPVGNRLRLDRALARLTDDQVEAGVHRLCEDIHRGAPIRSPFGLLISRAESDNHEFFAVPTSLDVANPVPDVVDDDDAPDEAELALMDMDADPARWADELAALDLAVGEYLHHQAPHNAERLVRVPALRRAARLDLLRQQLMKEVSE